MILMSEILIFLFFVWKILSEFAYLILFVLIFENYRMMDFNNTLNMVFLLSVQLIFLPNLVGYLFKDYIYKQEN